ncbi:Signal peptidase I S [Aedoeadaptatus ivorii]|uniref:Signal peptidase I n=1 Tax=Aedoeadaptatus ivorii TaxID=54006 RepID=A0A448V138_9FIRM|nr:signal peptidase I [Peptoniphilus ivorii]MDQ0507587.1 signal peptidase I [Peptoniphilus ivorii]VEJ35211.1 Signal peptidase I S [Peptoniphilus ivorii]
MKREEKSQSFAMEAIKLVVTAIVLALLIRTFIFNTTMVIGQSMEPTLHQNERLICLVFPNYYSDPARGEVVIIDAPDGSGKEYVKRVIGLPGDTVSIEGGKVLVNGVALKEPYIHPGIETEIYRESSWRLGEGEFFVLGDNRQPGMSVDSRYFGPVQKEHIRSRAALRYYPFQKFALFRSGGTE